MIWNSIFLMTLIDIVIIFISLTTLGIFYKYLHMIKTIKLTSGISLIAFALLLNTLFHGFDLLIMYQTSAETRVSIMTDLHLNWAWLKTLMSAGSISIGTSYLISVLIPKTIDSIETLQYTEKTLRKNNKDLEQQIETRLTELRFINTRLQHEIVERKITEEELTTSRSRWHSLVKNAPNILFEFDREGIIQFINFATVDMKLEEIVGTSLFNFTRPEEHDRVRSYIDTVFETGESISYETKGIDEHWYTVRIGAVKNEEQITGAIMILTDINDLKMSEIALRESETRFQNYMENLPGAVFLKDASDRLIYCNEFYARMIGYKSEDIIGKLSSEYTPETEINALFEKQNKLVLEQNKAQAFENVYPATIGFSYWETVKFPVKTPDGSLQLGAIALNVTERKEVENAIKRSEGRLRSITLASPDVTFILDRESTILDILTSREDLLSAPIDILKGQSIRNSKNLTQENIQALLAMIHNTFETGESHAHEYDIEVIAGHRWFDARTALLPTVEDEPEQILCVLRDITEQKHAELKLSQSKEIIALKDRIISTVSHEFRTPLAIIQSSSDLLTRYDNKLAPERKNSLFAQIKNQIVSLSKLIDDMLSVSRAQSGQIAFNPGMIDVEAFCHNILDQIKFLDRSHRDYIFDSRLSAKQAMIDVKLLEHILKNLLTNATKYSSPDRPVKLYLDHDDKNILIKVIDKGIGIPPENLENLFEPFFRAENVDKVAGTGMGLSIVKEYVELHGGTITVESKINEGSTFTITLPRNQTT